MKICVLGAGLVGGPLAIDLAKDDKFSVTVVDANSESLQQARQKEQSLHTVQLDLSLPEHVSGVIQDSDLVVNAMPGYLGFRTAKAIIDAGKNCVDIAFYEEDPFLLDEQARKNNVIYIMDCGVCPGLNNILIMHTVQQLDETETVLTLVGGLPQIRIWPSEYKAVFSPIDVIEEYTRPARFVENGKLVVRPALSDAELIHFPGIGTLEAFNTDGLRTLARTINAKNMKEKTLRYPGHIERMKILRELGFFSKEKTIEIYGRKIAPLEFTAKILFPHWKLEPGEGDITIMKITVEGFKNSKQRRYEYELIDYYDEKTDTISMARTTGYTAAMAVRLIANGMYSEIGVSPPEYIGKHSTCVEFLLEGLEQRGIKISQRIL